MIYFIFILLLSFLSCGGDSDAGIFNEPFLVGVDSTNDRLLVLETQKHVFSLTASTFEVNGEQPVVNSERQTEIFEMLPVIPTHFKVLPNGTTSRLFITGTLTDGIGNKVQNRILVLDYDGITFTKSAFSPIIVEDNDGNTDDTNNILGGLEVDTANSRLYVTDSSLGTLYVFSATDGSVVTPAIAIAGTPNRSSLDNGRLFVANSTAQLITVVNTADFTTTTIDMGVPTADIAVQSNAGGTALLAKTSGIARALVHQVNTTTYNASAGIDAGDASVETGEVNGKKGLTSAPGGVMLIKDASDIIHGYIPLADGNVVFLNFAADLSRFTAVSVETLSALLSQIGVLKNGNDIGTRIFIPAPSSGEILFTDIGTTEITRKFLTERN